MLAPSLRFLRAIAHRILPHGRSPAAWRRLVLAVERRLTYDAATQTVTVHSGPLAGMTKLGPFVDGDAAFAQGNYEPEIVAVLTEHCRPGAVAFDVGANVGYHTLLLSKLVGDQGEVHAFEPVPATAESLERTVEANGLANVVVHRLAVGASSGTAHMEHGDALESGRAHLVEGTVGYRWDRLAGPRQLVDVPLGSLDELHAAGTVPLPSLVKLDVEGAELLALAGMEQILREAGPTIVAELWGEHNIAEAQRLLGSLGYRVKVLSEWRGLVAGEPVVTRDVVASR